MDYGDGQTQTYQFDPMGNRLQKADSVTGTENYGYNNANMLLTRGTNNYTNDADGNTLTGGGRTNSWDSQNRMVQCVDGSNTSTYQYGSDGYRHRSTVNGMATDFALDGQMAVRELRAGTAYATYLTGASGPMYKLENTNGTIRWYLYDGLGSVLGEVDPSGNVATYAKYDVYGMVRSRTGQATSAHGFVGQLGHTSEPETGLIYMRARYTDPVTGRFISEDPGAHGINWYTYANENPVNMVDPSGKEGLDFGAIAIIWEILRGVGVPLPELPKELKLADSVFSKLLFAGVIIRLLVPLCAWAAAATPLLAVLGGILAAAVIVLAVCAIIAAVRQTVDFTASPVGDQSTTSSGSDNSG